MPLVSRLTRRRLRALPIHAHRALERTLAALAALAANVVWVAVVIVVALIMGFRTGASLALWLVVAGILVLFALALTRIVVIAGLSAKTVDGASSFS